MAKNTDVWTKQHIESLAPDDASISAARKVLTKGGFGTVEPTSDGRGWWVVCQGLTDKYQVSVQRSGARFECQCNCPSPKIPCKHALALLLHLVDHPELRTELEAPKKAAIDFESILRACFANPNEDTHRLVFADYLEENNQPDRAALIRYQCEQSRLKPGAVRYKQLKKLIAATEARVREQLGEFPRTVRFTFHRGFMRMDSRWMNYSVQTSSLPARYHSLFRDGWVEALVAHSYFLAQADLRPLVAQVGELDVSSEMRTDGQLTELATETAKWRAKGRLARVIVAKGNRKAFDRLWRFQQGEDVDLNTGLEPVRSYSNIINSSFNQLLRFGRFSKARDLDIRSSRNQALGEKQVVALLTADLSELRHLRLMSWNITKGAMDLLVNNPALASLSTLSLRYCEVNSYGVNALVGSSLFATLKTIELEGNALRKPSVNALLKPDVPTALKKLVLTNCGLGASDRKRLKRKYGEKLKI